MKELVAAYLDARLSRRGFVRRMVAWGFSAAAARSILESLSPLSDADCLAAVAEADPTSVTVVEGTGGRLLVEQLHAAGVRFVFNCNSSGTWAIFDALVDRPDVQVIQVPHEGQMVAVAQGYALASGTVAFTINGSVGLPNTLTNMYNAWKDRTPLVIGSQREPTAVQGGRDAFEEWDDYLGPAASFTRWRWSVEQATRIPEITRRAFKIAATPPEGPVALAFPTDVLAARGVRAPVVHRDTFMIAPTVRAAPAAIEEAARLLLAARNPLLVVGAEVTRSGGQADVVRLAERLSIPVTQGDRLFDDFPTGHRLFLGDYVWPLRRPAEVDLVLSLGSRMSFADEEMPAGARLIHVSIDPATIGTVASTDLGIVADVKHAAADLSAALESLATRARLAEVAAARLPAIETYTDGLRAARARSAQARWNSSPLSWERVAGELDRMLERDAIVVPELAEYRWSDDRWTRLVEKVGRMLAKAGLEAGPLVSVENTPLSQFTFGAGAKTRIGRTTGSALGWGVGAAIGVKLARPDRQVVALQGDGGFMFAQAEALWTMARYEVPVIVVIFNNRSYNGPRNKILNAGGRQAESGRDMTCYLGDPDVDFAKVAAGFGVKGEVVTAPAEVAPAIGRAIASTRDGKPYLIDAVVGRTGAGAASTWYPRYSVAAARTRTV